MKTTTKRAILFLLLIASLHSMAADYTHSIGLSVGGFNGITYKGFIFNVEGLALQADFGVRVSTMGVPGPTHVRYAKHPELNFSIKTKEPLVYYTVEVNPNIIYQRPFYSFNAGQLSWFAGGGVSLGALDAAYEWKHMGYNFNGEGKPANKHKLAFKFGMNALSGMELHFRSVPLALSLDFRLGYGLFSKHSKAGEWDDQYGNPQPYDSQDSRSFFDWALGASLRYCF